MGQIEDFSESLSACPECKSSEGFWLIAKRTTTFFQCKHCGVISEASKIYIHRKKAKSFKLVINLRR